MRCEEFWEKASPYLLEGKGQELLKQKDLERHLTGCRGCKKEWEVLEKGFSLLKEETHEKKSELFWIAMRKQVRENVNIPREKSTFVSPFCWISPKWLGAALAVSLMLVLSLHVFYRGEGPIETRQDIVAMFDPSPFSGDYLDQNDVRPSSEVEPMDEDLDPYILSGITDSWTAVLDQVEVGDGYAKGSGKKRNSAIKDNQKAMGKDKKGVFA